VLNKARGIPGDAFRIEGKLALTSRVRKIFDRERQNVCAIDISVSRFELPVEAARGESGEREASVTFETQRGTGKIFSFESAVTH
jgi:hypothetical protein